MVNPPGIPGASLKFFSSEQFHLHNPTTYFHDLLFAFNSHPIHLGEAYPLLPLLSVLNNCFNTTYIRFAS